VDVLATTATIAAPHTTPATAAAPSSLSPVERATARHPLRQLAQQQHLHHLEQPQFNLVGECFTEKGVAISVVEADDWLLLDLPANRHLVACPAHFDDLPPELLRRIFHCLPARAQEQFAQVCMPFRLAAEGHRFPAPFVITRCRDFPLGAAMQHLELRQLCNTVVHEEEESPTTSTTPSVRDRLGSTLGCMLSRAISAVRYGIE